MTDAGGVPLVVQLTAANEHDVKTLLPLWSPYAPSGANVTALDPASSRQFDGTLIWKTSPSL